MERPIIFGTEMVKAILDGRKTMTRRLSKLGEYNLKPDDWQVTPSLNPSVWAFYKMASVGVKDLVRIPCPYGQVGDRLWVRETHYHYGNWRLTGKITKTGKPEWEFVPSGYRRVNYFDNPPSNYRTRPSEKMGWYKRPSIFMPRWASRITLEITGVRVERLQEITHSDCIDEGCSHEDELNSIFHIKTAFRDLWDSLNAKRGYGWDTNPWVWVIKFKMPEAI